MTGLIVVGTDGSETAAIAVTEAAGWAAKLGAKLLIVSAVPPLTTTRIHEARRAVPEEFRWRFEPLAELEDTLAAAKEAVADTGVEVETLAKEGDPADVIIAAAEEHQAGLIVVGNRGMTGANRFLLGSVPNKVSHHASCSVLIVRTT
jgi:nucleotide-binding universal stress UspA family protein